MPTIVSEHHIQFICDSCGCVKDYSGTLDDCIEQALSEGWKHAEPEGVYCPRCAADHVRND